MSLVWLGALIVSWLLLFGVGYAWGKRHGRQEGERLGLSEAPLVWRQASLLKGQCVVCCGRNPATGESSACSEQA